MFQRAWKKSCTSTLLTTINSRSVEHHNTTSYGYHGVISNTTRGFHNPGYALTWKRRFYVCTSAWNLYLQLISCCWSNTFERWCRLLHKCAYNLYLSVQAPLHLCLFQDLKSNFSICFDKYTYNTALDFFSLLFL